MAAASPAPTEEIVMTPLRSKQGKTLRVERLPSGEIQPGKVYYAAEGPYAGIVLNKAANVRPSKSEPDSIRRFTAHVHSNSFTAIKEIRELRFWFKPEVGCDVENEANSFFKQLMNPAAFPRDYLAYVKTVLTLVTRFPHIKFIELEIRPFSEIDATLDVRGVSIANASKPLLRRVVSTVELQTKSSTTNLNQNNECQTLDNRKKKNQKRTTMTDFGKASDNANLPPAVFVVGSDRLAQSQPELEKIVDPYRSSRASAVLTSPEVIQSESGFDYGNNPFSPGESGSFDLTDETLKKTRKSTKKKLDRLESGSAADIRSDTLERSNLYAFPGQKSPIGNDDSSNGFDYMPRVAAAKSKKVPEHGTNEMVSLADSYLNVDLPSVDVVNLTESPHARVRRFRAENRDDSFNDDLNPMRGSKSALRSGGEGKRGNYVFNGKLETPAVNSSEKVDVGIDPIGSTKKVVMRNPSPPADLNQRFSDLEDDSFPSFNSPSPSAEHSLFKTRRPKSSSLREEAGSASVARAPSLDSDAQPTLMVITSLECEQAAVNAMLGISNIVQDQEEGGHSLCLLDNICIVSARLSKCGRTSAACEEAHSTINRLLDAYSQIAHVLLIGVGGAVNQSDGSQPAVNLGDVIIAKPTNPGEPTYLQASVTHRSSNKDGGAAVTSQTRLKLKFFTPESSELSQVIGKLQKAPKKLRKMVEVNIVEGLSVLEDQGLDVEEFTRPCDEERARFSGFEGARSAGGEDAPLVHFGLIATGKALNADDELRSELAELHQVRVVDAGFEAVLDALQSRGFFSYGLIRGAADRADGRSAGARAWQGRAALGAAAVMKCVLQGLTARLPSFSS